MMTPDEIAVSGELRSLATLSELQPLLQKHGVCISYRCSMESDVYYVRVERIRDDPDERIGEIVDRLRTCFAIYHKRVTRIGDINAGDPTAPLPACRVAST